jgi:hypothetical protein
VSAESARQRGTSAVPMKADIAPAVQKSRIPHRESASIISTTYSVQKSGANLGSLPAADLQTETGPDRHEFCSGRSAMLGQTEHSPQEPAS